jgi:hypothetical protein
VPRLLRLSDGSHRGKLALWRSLPGRSGIAPTVAPAHGLLLSLGLLGSHSHQAHLLRLFQGPQTCQLNWIRPLVVRRVATAARDATGVKVGLECVGKEKVLVTDVGRRPLLFKVGVGAGKRRSSWPRGESAWRVLWVGGIAGSRANVHGCGHAAV